jgi:hypothetical protein
MVSDTACVVKWKAHIMASRKQRERQQRRSRERARERERERERERILVLVVFLLFPLSFHHSPKSMAWCHHIQGRSSPLSWSFPEIPS